MPAETHIRHCETSLSPAATAWFIVENTRETVQMKPRCARRCRRLCLHPDHQNVGAEAGDLVRLSDIGIPIWSKLPPLQGKWMSKTLALGVAAVVLLGAAMPASARGGYGGGYGRGYGGGYGHGYGGGYGRGYGGGYGHRYGYGYGRGYGYRGYYGPGYGWGYGGYGYRFGYYPFVYAPPPVYYAPPPVYYPPPAYYPPPVYR
jgi:hypothetical protein